MTASRKSANSFASTFSFLLILFSGAAGAVAQENVDFKSGFYAAAFDRSWPAFTWLSADSLGYEEVSHNAVQTAARTNGPFALQQSAKRRFCYMQNAPGGKPTPVWEITLAEKRMTLSSRYSETAPAPPFTLTIDQKKNHATLLGLIKPDGSIELPAILHLPDQGSFRISSKVIDSLGYEAAQGIVKIIFKGATRENPVVKYRCETVSIYPKVDTIGADARFDSFRRDWLNILQISQIG